MQVYHFKSISNIRNCVCWCCTIGQFEYGDGRCIIINNLYHDFLLTAQHFIYALTLRNNISILSLPKRLSLGFLLTDELFALSAPNEKRHPHYLLGRVYVFIYSGGFSLVGILLATAIPDLLSYHLDFSIIAFCGHDYSYV